MPFGEVVGHRALVQLIARAVARDTLPPSLLLVGLAGVGKRLVATALAQTLNCPSLVRHPPGDPSSKPHDGFDLDACGECSACKRIARGSYADVVTLEPGGERLYHHRRGTPGGWSDRLPSVRRPPSSRDR